MKRFYLALIALSVLAGLSAILILLWQGHRPEVSAETDRSWNIGVSYIALVPSLATYYDLNIHSGALVTEVAPQSVAARVGLRAGDVILSFNGAKLDEHNGLLGMMGACQAGSKVTLEVWRGGNVETMEFIHEVEGNGQACPSCRR